MKKNDPVTSRMNGSSASAKTGLTTGLSKSSINGHNNLEDVIVQLEKRDSDKKNLSRTSSSSRKLINNSSNSVEMMNDSELNYSDTEMDSESGNVYQQLAQKEKDLILAAEVGKALLERNEELTLANEKITEEYSHKLEVRIFPIFLSSNLFSRSICLFLY